MRGHVAGFAAHYDAVRKTKRVYSARLAHAHRNPRQLRDSRRARRRPGDDARVVPPRRDARGEVAFVAAVVDQRLVHVGNALEDGRVRRQRERVHAFEARVQRTRDDRRHE